jgi:hypothetical protein
VNVRVSIGYLLQERQKLRSYARFSSHSSVMP